MRKLLVNSRFLARTHACMVAVSICDSHGPLSPTDMIDKWIELNGDEGLFGVVFWTSRFLNSKFWKAASLLLCYNAHKYLTERERRTLAIHAVNVVLRKYYANEAASINRSVRGL